MGTSELAGFSRSAPSFWLIWSYIVRATFTSSEVTTPATTVTGDDYFSAKSNRRETNMNEIDWSTSDGQTGTWTLKKGFPDSGKPYSMVKMGAYLKHVEYRVVNKTTMKLAWNANAEGLPVSSGGTSCVSDLSWTFDMCKSCECTLPSGAKGLISSTFLHKMVLPAAADCGPFFVKYDKAFREYMAGLRATMLSLKATCCNPWDSNIASAISGKTNDDCVKTGGRVPNYGVPLLNGNAALTPSEGNVDSQSGSTVGLCPAIKADSRKDYVCGGASTPPAAPTSGGSSSVSFNLIHTGHSDITANHKSKLELSCVKHAWVMKTLLGAGIHAVHGKAEWNALTDKGWLNWMTDRPRFATMIICAEGPDDGSDSDIGSGYYPDAAREAFAMLMGQHYFTPRVTEVSTSATGKYVEFEIGCGGYDLELAQYYSGLHAYDYGKVARPGWMDRSMEPKDPAGDALKVNGKFKIGAVKMDGGKSDWGGGLDSQIATGLNYRRRRDNTPGWLPSWRDTRSGNWGKYRPDMGGTSRTCCPPKGIAQEWNPLDMFSAVPESGDWRSTPDALAVPCFRGLFGETQSCRSKLYLHISTCDSCDCTNDVGHNVLVNVDTRHFLDTDNVACKPWFSQVDAAIRSYIAAIRKQVVNDKVDSC